MPAHWLVRRAKYLFRNVYEPPREEDSIITAYRDGQVTLRENRRSGDTALPLKKLVINTSVVGIS
jgi:hypothetical protein